MFDAKKTTKDIIEWIKKYFEQNGKDSKAVVGISGGKDSSVVAALCVKSLGKERVLGVLMPQGVQPDIDVSYNLCYYLNIPFVEVNIGKTAQTLLNQIENSFIKNYNNSFLANLNNMQNNNTQTNNKQNINVQINNNTQNNITQNNITQNNITQNNITQNSTTQNNNTQNNVLRLNNIAVFNTPARVRMATLYAISGIVNGRVANTCNLSEDFVGYSTKFGDSAGDFAPISSLTVTEVKAVGQELGLDAKFIQKTPIDGLCGKTDEENLGFSYDVLDKYIRENICEDKEVKAKIDRLHLQNLHKLNPIPSFKL